MRLVLLSTLALIGCADAELTSIDVGEFEATRTMADDATAPPTMQVYVPIDGPVPGTVSAIAEDHRMDGDFRATPPEADGSEDGGSANPEPGLENPEDDGVDEGVDEEAPGRDPAEAQPGPVRPVAVMFVVDQNADMFDVAHLLSEPAVAGARALMESHDESYFGLIGHVDRRAHLLYALEEVRPEQHRLMFGASASITTCSTLEDMHGWEELGYDHPVLLAPPCWSDEHGRDPATALAFAHHVLSRDAPLEAEKAIVWIGARPPASIESGHRRPQGYGDQTETWRRTDREVPADILMAHTEFVLSEMQAEGVHVLHVPVGDASQNGWQAMLGVDVAPGETATDRAAAVHGFVQGLRVHAQP